MLKFHFTWNLSNVILFSFPSCQIGNSYSCYRCVQYVVSIIRVIRFADDTLLAFSPRYGLRLPAVYKYEYKFLFLARMVYIFLCALKRTWCYIGPSDCTWEQTNLFIISAERSAARNESSSANWGTDPYLLHTFLVCAFSHFLGLRFRKNCFLQR